jgi:hypothetical protein
MGRRRARDVQTRFAAMSVVLRVPLVTRVKPDRCAIIAWVWLRIPTKPATCSDPKPVGVPI